jgi:hypothetical protein
MSDDVGVKTSESMADVRSRVHDTHDGDDDESIFNLSHSCRCVKLRRSDMVHDCDIQVTPSAIDVCNTQEQSCHVNGRHVRVQLQRIKQVQ